MGNYQSILGTPIDIIHVKGLDMHGSDIMKVSGVDENSAYSFVINKIRFNERLCGVLIEENNGTYTACIRLAQKCNPTEGNLMWHRYSTVFIGRKYDLNKLTSFETKNQEGEQKPRINQQHGVVNIDMCGENLQVFSFQTYPEAYERTVQLVDNPSKCATIVEVWEEGRWIVNLKDIRKTNPSKSNNHYRSHTVFFNGP